MIPNLPTSQTLRRVCPERGKGSTFGWVCGADLLVVLFLVAWPFVYFWQATFRQAVFSFGDILLFFYPTHLSYANALREGRLPLWDPKMLAGFPLFAEGQISALNPLHLILYRFLPIDVATNYDILIHLAWVAVGMYLFARAIKLQPASAFLAALAFGFGGFFVARLQHMSIMATASWLPWLMWAWEKRAQEMDRKKRWRWFALMALFSAIQLFGGHPQFAFSSALLLGLYAVVRWKGGGTTTTTEHATRNTNVVRGACSVAQRLFSEYLNLSQLLPAIMIFALGAALAAVQLVPTFELSSFTDRATGLLPKFFNAFSLRPPHFLMLFHPFLLGNPYPNVSVEVIGYVGFLPLILAIGAPFVQRDRRVVFFVLIALVALFLGLGDLNVFYRGLRYLPLFNYFRVPSRFLFWFVFAAAMLAGITFDHLLARARTTVQLTRAQKTALALVAIVLAIIVGLVPALPLDVWISMWVWLPFVFALVTVWIVLGARRGFFTRTMLGTLALGVTVIDLALFASVYSKTYDAMSSVADFYAPPRSLPVLKNLSPQDGRVLTSLWIYPVPVTMRDSLYPNISMSYGLHSGIGYTPLLPQNTALYIEKMSAQMLNLMNVRYYLRPQLLPTNPKTEGQDLENPFALECVAHYVSIPPTAVSKIEITSSLAQSVDFENGMAVAQIGLVTQDGQWQTTLLRAGVDTAEWAYERSDVRKVIQHAMPRIATTFPARSAFPTEDHVGHNYLAQLDVTRDGKPLTITGFYVLPIVPTGLLHVQRVVLVTPEGEEISLAHLAGQSEQVLVYRSNEVAIFENLDMLPRAFLVHDAHLASDQVTLDEMTRDDFKPLQTLILADGEPMQNGGAQRADESVRIVEYQPERVALSVRASAEGYVLLADAWYPGWIARVDGVETPIRRADLIYRAVRVGAGEHRIEFEYRPMSFYLGVVVTLIAATVLVSVVVIALWCPLCHLCPLRLLMPSSEVGV